MKTLRFIILLVLVLVLKTYLNPENLDLKSAIFSRSEPGGVPHIAPGHALSFLNLAIMCM